MQFSLEKKTRQKKENGFIITLLVNSSYTSPWIPAGTKLTIKILEQRQWRRSGIFIVNFEQVNTDLDLVIKWGNRFINSTI